MDITTNISLEENISKIVCFTGKKLLLENEQISHTNKDYLFWKCTSN